MTWARFDDNFLDSPDALRAGEDATNLHLRATIWCSKHLTDGAIPREALRAITQKRRPERLAARLVDVGVWKETPEGWVIPRFTDTNPARVEVEARRSDLSEKRAAAGRIGGKHSASVRSAASNREANGQATAEANGKQVASPLRSKTQAPSRPVPSRRLPESETTSPPAADDAGASPAAPDAGGAADVAVPARRGATKARRGGGTDSLPPEPGTGAARALEALRASPTLAAIVDRPNALCAAIGANPDPALDAYPAVDVPREIRAADAWLVANPRKRKSDGARFLAGWLSSAQERASRVGAPTVDGRHGRPMRPPPPVSVPVLPPPLPAVAVAVDPARAAERRAELMSALKATEKPS